MSESSGESAAADTETEGLPDRWAPIIEDLDELVTGPTDIRVYEMGANTIELRVLPTGVGEELEAEYTALSTIVHSGFRIVLEQEE